MAVSCILCPRNITLSASILHTDLERKMLVFFNLKVSGKEKELCWLSFSLNYVTSQNYSFHIILTLFYRRPWKKLPDLPWCILTQLLIILCEKWRTLNKCRSWQNAWTTGRNWDSPGQTIMWNVVVNDCSVWNYPKKQWPKTILSLHLMILWVRNSGIQAELNWIIFLFYVSSAEVTGWYSAGSWSGLEAPRWIHSHAWHFGKNSCHSFFFSTVISGLLH